MRSCFVLVTYTFLHLYLFAQGDLGPFNPGLPVDVPVWLALNLKQRQKCRIVPPEWMEVGKSGQLHKQSTKIVNVMQSFTVLLEDHY